MSKLMCIELCSNIEILLRIYFTYIYLSFDGWWASGLLCVCVCVKGNSNNSRNNLILGIISICNLFQLELTRHGHFQLRICSLFLLNHKWGKIKLPRVKILMIEYHWIQLNCIQNCLNNTYIICTYYTYSTYYKWFVRFHIVQVPFVLLLWWRCISHWKWSMILLKLNHLQTRLHQIASSMSLNSNFFISFSFERKHYKHWHVHCTCTLHAHYMHSSTHDVYWHIRSYFTMS